MLFQQVHDRRLSVGRIRHRISVYLPRVPGALPLIRRHPFLDRLMRFVHSVVRAAMDRDGSLARWRFGRVHFANRFECARDLDTEVAQYWCAPLTWMVIQKNVVTVCP